MKILSHEKLGISFAELGALLAVRTMLATGVLTDAKGRSLPDESEHGFNMNQACQTDGCGSIGCIGGTMGQIMQAGNPARYVKQQDYDHTPLGPLFFPRFTKGKRTGQDLPSWDEIKPREAIRAIDSFLATGKPHWQKVLGAERIKRLEKIA